MFPVLPSKVVDEEKKKEERKRIVIVVSSTCHKCYVRGRGGQCVGQNNTLFESEPSFVNV
jgi:hypothetical protein